MGSDTHIHIHLNGSEVSSTPTQGKRRKKAATKASGPKKRTRKKDPKMKAAMKKAHKAAKRKDGTFRKGWDQSKLMKHAHKLKKR